ncbi:hypothetical protein K5B43_003839 [Vibrio parahaemolyticus]|uniref:hypothetical protein n=1 Tax=Vibrio parahaemolyticus TaxID=670 RepID=UPI001122E137|nr:hypothetical protein [Vibrio parahaemolyticus]EGQ8127644.1 hypothetical protein [Vibrio parahaemolyticus]EHY9860539.1 hypothetical protein [Vibrio parahaemolyticus]EJB8445339.1 hypothetical protein [Vibrio parahaemolyticus]EKL9962042.1 hypothetical protein [Vibrio parahaemolyticus]ELB2005150.1 hypothetical protein [Vibrio parahaemolyticus]
MIYEKKTKKEIGYVRNAFAYGAIAVIAFVYFIYAFLSFSEIAGGVAKATDIINSIAQLATASAFLLAVHQYRKNSRKERQETVCSEAKNTITTMVELSDELNAESSLSIEKLNLFLSKMTNVGSDFHVLYEAMDDDIYKAIVRMQWQNMFFNHLRPVLVELDYKTLLEDTYSDHVLLCHALMEGDNRASKEKVFKEYAKANYVLRDSLVKHKLHLQINNISSFKKFYLDDKALNDVLYGVLSRIDIRAVCPLLAVIDEMNKRT